MTKRLYKSDADKVWSGVIGGIGEYFDVDPVLLRVGWIIIAMFTGFVPGLIAYVIAAVIVPKKPGAHKHSDE